MASNPLLGKRISLVSKKNIRYEGILYSINEQNATVALQNVTSFGTEGREAATFVAPETESVYPFLLFRGQDIKDLHVHETVTPAAAEVPPGTPTPPAAVSPATKQESPVKQAAPAPKPAPAAESSAPPAQRQAPPQAKLKQQQRTNAPVGTGASLLNASTRGPRGKAATPQQPLGDFDFEANQKQFEQAAGNVDDDDEAGDELPSAAAARSRVPAADDGMDNGFFDSISCDALDKEAGIDHRLRGAQERHLNTETFGAVALKKGRGGGRYNNQNRRYNNSNNSSAAGRGGRGAGDGGGRSGGGRSRGRGAGRGRGRGGPDGTSSGGRGRGSQRQPTSAAVNG